MKFFKRFQKLMVFSLASLGLFILFAPKVALKTNLQNKQINLKCRIASTQNEIANLRKRENDLNSSSHYLEKLARDKLGYCATDEIIYKFQ